MNSVRSGKRVLERAAYGMGRRLPESGKRAVLAAESLLGHPPRFFIVSTGRAGSTFIAELLTRIGIPCSHEGFVTPDGIRNRLLYQGESSWLAVPFLEAGAFGDGIPIVHQVRDPLEVLSSFYGIRFFSERKRTRFTRFARQHFATSGDELKDGMRWWTEWNRRCESLATLTYPVEDLEERFPEVLRTLGYAPGDLDWKEAFSDLRSRKVNARSRANLTLGDLPEGPDRDAMVDLARRYGYGY